MLVYSVNLYIAFSKAFHITETTHFFPNLPFHWDVHNDQLRVFSSPKHSSKVWVD